MEQRLLILLLELSILSLSQARYNFLIPEQVYNHICMLTNLFLSQCSENGAIKTWGWGEHGQLGLGDDGDRISPVTVILGYDLNEAASIRVYCGSGFTFALTKP